MGDAKWRRTEVSSKDSIQLARTDRELGCQFGNRVLVEIPTIDQLKCPRQDDS